MWEIADELGREHILALKKLYAADQEKDIRDIWCVVYPHDEWLKHKKSSDLPSVPEKMVWRGSTKPQYVRADVFGMLLSHGLVRQPHESDKNGEAEGFWGTMTSERGKELLNQRPFFVWVISRFPARWNRRLLAFWMLFGGPAAGSCATLLLEKWV